MSLQVLISVLNKEVRNLAQDMNLQSDALIINQCDCEEHITYSHRGHEISCYSFSERGVGRSRNHALELAEADICLFSDEDIVFDDGYEEKVLEAFEKNPEADVITFNFRVDERRRTYFNEKPHPIHWRNYGRYPAYAIAIRLKSIREKEIKYSLLYGGGAKYSCGEDSLFLHDCLKKGLHLFAETAILGCEQYRESTWFEGYTEKYFFDRGVLYADLYGTFAEILGFRYLLKNRTRMCKDIVFWKAFSLLRKGVKEGRSNRKNHVIL